jgi:4-hydroxy-tetrahydrodipicolinate synthase
MLSGVWIPLVTPFKDGAVDLDSYRGLIEYYLAEGTTGLFPLGTTGESPTLDDDEEHALIATTVEAVADRVPIFVGIGGNATAKVVRKIDRLSRHNFQGIVSVCPYYNRPSQAGLIEHFGAIAGATDRDVLIYNIPYRTAVNLSNDSLIQLAAVPNIVGVKDSSGSIAQSLDLLATRPEGFSVLTGEDPLFFTSLCNGASGGILAAAHIAPNRYVRIAELLQADELDAARALWVPLQRFIPKLFQEANPMPIKRCLWRQGLIASAECRLPLTSVSEGLAQELDEMLPTIA